MIAEEEENLVAIEFNSCLIFMKNGKLKIIEDFAKFGLEVPTSEFMQKGSRKGIHRIFWIYFVRIAIICKRTYQIVFSEKLEV